MTFTKPDLKEQLYVAMRELRDLKQSKREMTAAINEQIKESEEQVRSIIRGIEDDDKQMHLADV